MEVSADDLPAAEGRVFVGLDIGGSRSMTAAVLLWESGRVEALDRSRQRARQDVISAAVIACGLRALDQAGGSGDLDMILVPGA